MLGIVKLSNLTEVAKFYESKKRQKEFVDLVKKASAAAAAAADVSTAFEMIESVAINPSEELDKFTSYAIGAILGMAVIYYGRATKISSGSKDSVDLAPHLNGNLLQVHNELINLRDDAIAHRGSGKRGDKEPWSKAALVLRFINDLPETIGFEPTQRLFDPTTFYKLKQHLPAALKIIDAITHEHINELAVVIDRIAGENESFKIRIHETLLDRATFLGITSAADAHHKPPGRTPTGPYISSIDYD